VLDLRGHGPENGAWLVGSVHALSSNADYTASQAWSRHFYEQHDTYTLIDGITDSNAHNGDDARALYERCEHELVCDPDDVARLNDPAFRTTLLGSAFKLGLTLPPR